MWFKKRHQLDRLALELRLALLEMIYKSGGGHLGGSFSALDLITAIYFSNIFKFPPDHFILSAGHLAPALDTVLAKAGYFPNDLLDGYGSLGSPLQGHVSTETNGVEYSSGALGQGLSVAAGLALAKPKSRVVCLTSDGEHNEGQVWEAIMFANKYKLGNLINVVDVNGCQIGGTTDEIMPLGNLASKYLSFGWIVIGVDGHNFEDIERGYLKASNGRGSPTCILAKTTLARGIDFMSSLPKYHDVKQLKESVYQRAVISLKRFYEKD